MQLTSHIRDVFQLPHSWRFVAFAPHVWFHWSFLVIEAWYSDQCHDLSSPAPKSLHLRSNFVEAFLKRVTLA